MDDGSKTRSGFYLHTEGFTKNEVYLLIGMLHYKFNLVCTAQKQKNNLRIYIRASSIKTFRALVLPYFEQSILYKLQ